MAVVANAGWLLGSMMRKKMVKYEQPSMIAALSKSLGIVKKNCRKKNMLNAFEEVNMLVRNRAKNVL